MKVKNIYTKQCKKGLTFHLPLMHQSQYKILPIAPLEMREDTKQTSLYNIYITNFPPPCIYAFTTL
jgi:hypothetical protein